MRERAGHVKMCADILKHDTEALAAPCRDTIVPCLADASVDRYKRKAL